MTLKRSELRRKSSALSRSPLRTRPKPRTVDPRAIEFKRVTWGFCSVCGSEGLVRRHHCVTERHVIEAGGDPWNLCNGMWLGVESLCNCHSRHTSKFGRIPLPLVPDSAVAFAVDLFGSDEAAAQYFVRYYSPEVN